MISELAVERLRWFCDPGTVGCSISSEMKPLQAIIGQERAIKALKFGLEIKELGFNMYVAGFPGTGRSTAVKQFLEVMAKGRPTPKDWCYVTNFRDNYRPRAISFPAGKGAEFRADMAKLVKDMQRHLPRAFESEEYLSRGEDLMKGFQQKRESLLTQFTDQAQKEGFVLQATPFGVMIVPVKEGKPLNEEDFMGLPSEEKNKITVQRDRLQDELKSIMRQGTNLEKSAFEEIQKMDRDLARYTLDPLFEELKEKYQESKDVLKYLEEVQEDILKNLSYFRPQPQQQVPVQAASPFPMQDPKEQIVKRYEVNVLVDNSGLQGAPVVLEYSPTYNNLFGRIEKEAQYMGLVTDFTMIREGALHRANGGFIVLNIEDVLRNFFSWDGLKTSLRNREVAIEEVGEKLGYMTTKSLRPEPIPLDVKVVLIGPSWLYYSIYSLDNDFRGLFKVKADFDTVMDRTDKNIRDFSSFVCTVCQEEQLKHLDSSGLGKLIEYGARIAGDQEKLSTRFNDLSDVIREASYYSTQEGLDYVDAEHVKKAIEERFYRSSLIQNRIEEMIEQGILMIDVSGENVGMVNGLSVMDLGDVMIGRPNRITASISLGREGLVDIEREAKLGGPIHTKGVLILSGYLSERYAKDKPLSLSARLVFEQSYSGVEGDSASSTELYAILSSISNLPIKQSIAVTGSVNQKGEVQAIGGVNEKIEGFFEVCKAKGLNGSQGVMIPASNVRNLMLKEEILEEVRQGRFHVWPVKHIDEGIEILTGIKGGTRKEDGTFEEGTVNFLVDQQLKKFSDQLKSFAEGRKGEERKSE
jgi:lon-related putative ATP-dependent protease